MSVPLWVVVFVVFVLLSIRLGKSQGPWDQTSWLGGCAMLMLGVVVAMVVWYFTEASR